MVAESVSHVASSGGGTILSGGGTILSGGEALSFPIAFAWPFG
jgi:hypothetical protein